jgi:hypothetical protein
MRLKPDAVTRSFMAILLAFLLAGLSGPVFAGTGPDCPMAHMPGGMGHHGKMGHCPPECAVTCPQGTLAIVAAYDPLIEPPAMPAAAPAVAVLRSFNPAAADPPPRTGNS